MSLRRSPNDTTGFSPHELVLGEKPNPLVLDLSQHTRESGIERPIHVHVRNSKRDSLIPPSLGDSVMVKNHKKNSLDPNYKSPEKVAKIYNDISEVTQEENGIKTSNIHHHLLEKIPDPDISESLKTENEPQTSSKRPS
ncbi:hypothetical protein RF11_15339 [Thelohanellus kitauei]|uniref:Uncharacterized protein n=1 Tax=Thelohanellus kitauei TaxID=669202 RepID=A0A0C2ITZ3_THEKT|nr:hypothetical protein RF11_15339 [Thelohanellus kitauei]